MSIFELLAAPDKQVPHWIGTGTDTTSEGTLSEIVDPRTNLAIGTTSSATRETVGRAVAEAALAQREWAELSAIVRSEKLMLLGHLMLENAEQLAELEASETGKPLAGARLEIKNAAQYFTYYAGMAPALSGETIDMGADFHSYTLRAPYGVVGVITPWNAPLNQAARAAAPALAAGNAVVIKPSEFTPSTTVALASLALEAGLPSGLLGVVNGTGQVAGEALLRDTRVSKVSFTGSVRTGQAIGAIAAERMLPLSLELGGKSANIIFADGDLEAAATVAARAFLINTGQACSAGSRVLVERSVHDEFVELLKKAVDGFVAKNPVGPLTTRAQFAKVTEILQDAKDEGLETYSARVPRDTDEGLFIDPTFFTGVTNDMTIAQEEVFGPVGVVIPFDDEEDAVRIANDSQYGLAGGLWTRDVSRALRVARRIESGQVYVNTWLGPTIDLPFGGYKMSGYGREKGFEALLSYTHTKAIAVAL